jgi:alkyl hydroperoxide reductase subunit AhpF
MGFLSAADEAHLRERFEAELVQPVRVLLFTEPAGGLYVPGRRACRTCADTEALMTEVAGFSDNIDLEIVNVTTAPETAAEWGVSITPTIAVCRESDQGVRFVGLPGGYEFTSFIETLVSAGAGNGSHLTPGTLERLAAVSDDIDIKTFITPT